MMSANCSYRCCFSHMSQLHSNFVLHTTCMHRPDNLENKDGLECRPWLEQQCRNSHQSNAKHGAAVMYKSARVTAVWFRHHHVVLAGLAPHACALQPMLAA